MSHFLVIFGALLCVALAQPPDNKISNEQKAACMEEAGFSKEEIAFHQKNHHGLLMGPERDPKGACFIKCLWTATSFLDADGNIDMEMIKTNEYRQYTEEEIKTVYECAAQVKIVKECEDVDKLFACFPKHLRGPPPP